VSQRRRAPGVPFYYPDWLEVHEIERDVRAALREFGRGRLLDVGCGAMPYRVYGDLITDWIGFDSIENQGADVHGSADALPFPDASFDTVLCTQLLEHVEHPGKVLAECARILTPEGSLVVTAPQYWELHEEPRDYYRYTMNGLRYLVENAGLKVLRTCSQGIAPALGAQSLNLMMLHAGERWPLMRTWPVRAAKVPFYAVVNLMALACASLFRNSRDAMNHLIVAAKPH